MMIRRSLSTELPPWNPEPSRVLSERPCPPEDYVCARCNGTDHFIHHCRQAKRPKREAKRTAKKTEFLPIADHLWKALQKDYGLEGIDLQKHLVAQTGDASCVYLINDPALCQGIDVVSPGLRAFVKDKPHAPHFRITQVCLPYLLKGANLTPVV